MCLDWISSSQVLLGRMISANHDQQLQFWKMQMLLLKVREKLTAHPILSSYWCDRRISWQCFTRHLLTPKKHSFNSGLWKLCIIIGRVQSKVNKRLLKKIMVTQKVLSPLYQSSETAVSGIWNIIPLHTCWSICLTFFTKRETTDHDADSFGMDQ